jgi:phosphate transport system protein
LDRRIAASVAPRRRGQAARRSAGETAWIAAPVLRGRIARGLLFWALPLDTVGGLPETRHRFQEDLAALERQALGGLDLVIGQLDRALESLMYQDVELAGMVVAGDHRIDGRYLEVHQGLLSLLARQAPVAGDLRIVAALLHSIRCIERMGDQCVNIAKLIPLSGYEPPKDKDIVDAIERMGRLTRSLVCQAKESFAERNVAIAQNLVRQDAEINRLNRAIFSRAVEIGDHLELREWAMFMILVARAIERIADNTVDIAEQTAFVVTGLFREFTDASQPG